MFQRHRLSLYDVCIDIFKVTESAAMLTLVTLLIIASMVRFAPFVFWSAPSLGHRFA